MIKLLIISVILLNTACAEPKPVHKCPSFTIDQKIGCGIKKDTW